MKPELTVLSNFTLDLMFLYIDIITFKIFSAYAQFNKFIPQDVANNVIKSFGEVNKSAKKFFPFTQQMINYTMKGVVGWCDGAG